MEDPVSAKSLNSYPNLKLVYYVHTLHTTFPLRENEYNVE